MKKECVSFSLEVTCISIFHMRFLNCSSPTGPDNIVKVSSMQTRLLHAYYGSVLKCL